MRSLTTLIVLFGITCLFLGALAQDENYADEEAKIKQYEEEEEREAEEGEEGEEPEEAGEEQKYAPGEEEVGTSFPEGSDVGAPEPECGTIINGYRFDLEPLMRTSGPDYNARDEHGNEYYLNVCENVMTVPEECKEVDDAGIRSPAFQVTNTSLCYWLGLLGEEKDENPPTWSLIDEQDPLMGVEVNYWDGAQCSDGQSYRHVRFQFFCDEEVESDLSNGVIEFAGSCHYSVIWPSKYGCPTNFGGSGSGLGSGWTFVLFLIFAASCYVGLGCAYNVVNRGMRVGMEAMPHIDQWRLLPEYVMEGINFTRGKAQEVLGQKTGYEKVDGVEYQWG